MHLRRPSLFVLALVLTSCSTTAGGSLGEEGTTATARRGNTNLIVRSELDAFSGESARDVIERLRPSWVRPARGVSLAAGRAYPGVIVDGASRRDLDELDRLNCIDIESMRFLSATDATTKYGTGFMGGAIEVTMRGL